MRSPLRLLLATAAAGALAGAVPAAAAPGNAPVHRAGPVATLPDLPPVDIAYTKTTLPNGLTLLVHEDHKAPIVAVNIWYHVGSKNEPPGRSGFAHLFEHLMFGGKSEKQGGWFEKMEAIGATDLNGTTYYDRTNFFETVPVPALDMTLYLEAQRMGHLLDGFTEATLNTQRGVVQNEKRQDENQPYRVSEELITKSVFPASHPYSHTVIGEMTDLDAAKVADVKDWFSKFYGPGNAVIAISGDITPAEARAKVARYFDAIAPGPPVSRQKAWIAPRTGSQRATAQDHVAQARLYKVWNTPGYATPDDDYLSLLSDILTTGKDSRLYRRLVYQDQIATTVESYEDDREIGGLFQVELTAKPGVPLSRLETAFNDELGRLLKEGPTRDEVERYRTRTVANVIRGVERVGGFGGSSDTLASAYTYTGSPDAWKVSLARVRAATPADIAAAGRRWLSDGDFTLELTPFADARASGGPAGALPTPGAGKPPVFARFRRAELKNGLKVVVAERHDSPTVVFDLVLDAGRASDEGVRPGAADLVAALLSDGTGKLDALEVSDRLMQLGATFQARAGTDTASITLNALTTRLDPALDLYADLVRRPALREADVAREKALRVAAIQQAKAEPTSEAIRIEPTLVYGRDHPYGALSTEASVAALTRDDVARFHATWFQPAGATLVVVGDTTLEQVLPRLEARFGDWAPRPTPPRAVGAVKPVSSQVVYLIDKPDALQTVIAAGGIAPPRANPDDLAIQAMNTSLGGAFTSRLNLNLREDKHWAYGAFSFVQDARGPSLFTALAPVQTDKTAESFAEMRRELSEIAGKRPVSPQELVLAQGTLTRSLPGQWETNAAVAGAIADLVSYRLPDAYYDTFSTGVGALTVADVSRAAHVVIAPQAFTWVVVGDRKVVEPGLRAQGLEVRPIDADGRPLG